MMFKTVAAALVGNMLEVYDMVIYGLLSPIIAQNFFPKQDKLVGIVDAFAIFFIGYLSRPLGALIFGRIGDRLGRKPALISSIWLMVFSSFCLGLLPDYRAIAFWAPILLLFFRLLQGLSFGAEYPGSVIFLVEHAPKTQRGFYGCFAGIGAVLGLLLASLVTWLLHVYFSQSALLTWAWRLPFLLAVLGGFVGWFVRRRMPETELFYENYRLPASYFQSRRDFAKQLQRVVLIIGITLFAAVIVYLLYVFFVAYMTAVLNYKPYQALFINTISIILLVFLNPLVAKLADRVGRRPMMALGLISTIMWAFPYFFLLQQHNLALALLAQLVMTTVASAYLAVNLVTMVEIVPAQMRFTVVAFAYSITMSLFGGITPFLATLLIKLTHSYYSLALYMSICALISLITVIKVRETKYVPQDI